MDTADEKIFPASAGNGTYTIQLMVHATPLKEKKYLKRQNP
jgi:hypothetical protein